MSESEFVMNWDKPLRDATYEELVVAIQQMTRASVVIATAPGVSGFSMIADGDGVSIAGLLSLAHQAHSAKFGEVPDDPE